MANSLGPIPCFNISTLFNKVLSHFHKTIGAGKVERCITILISTLCCVRLQLSNDTVATQEIELCIITISVNKYDDIILSIKY